VPFVVGVCADSAARSGGGGELGHANMSALMLKTAPIGALFCRMCVAPVATVRGADLRAIQSRAR